MDVESKDFPTTNINGTTMCPSSSSTSTSTSYSLSREDVSTVVDMYGKAWTTQNPKLLHSIFTNDATYVERALDQKATFVGIHAITKYWKYQICGKQSNIQFRHLQSRMVLDTSMSMSNSDSNSNPTTSATNTKTTQKEKSERKTRRRMVGVAVVQWMAEFDNIRQHRAEKALKRVRFIQMARLEFSLPVENTNNGNNIQNVPTDHNNSMTSTTRGMIPKIHYLEEYAQSMTGPGVIWPGLHPHMTDDIYEAALRGNSRVKGSSPSTVGRATSTITKCNICEQVFPSRSQLFKHLKTTQEKVDPTNGDVSYCIPIIVDETNNDTLDRQDEWQWISLSLGYTPQKMSYQTSTEDTERDDTDDDDDNNDYQKQLETRLSQALIHLATATATNDIVDDNEKIITEEDDHLDTTTTNDFFDSISFTWAVPPNWSSSAVTNVVSLKVRKLSSNRLMNDLIFNFHKNKNDKLDNDNDGEDEDRDEVERNKYTSQINMATSLNEALFYFSSVSDERKTAPPRKKKNNNDNSNTMQISIHTVVAVDRPCIESRREFERYESIIPWKFFFLPKEDDKLLIDPMIHERKDTSSTTTTKTAKNAKTATTTTSTDEHYAGWSRLSELHQPIGRQPLEDTAAGKHCSREITKRLRQATRILKDGGRDDVGDFFDNPIDAINVMITDNDTHDDDRGGNHHELGALKVRLRTSTLPIPYEECCRISISMRQPTSSKRCKGGGDSGGYVERMLALLIHYARKTTMTEEELKEQVLQHWLSFSKTTPTASPAGAGTAFTTNTTPQITKRQNLHWMNAFPSECICLWEPCLTRFELKAKIQLSRTSAVPTATRKKNCVSSMQKKKTKTKMNNYAGVVDQGSEEIENKGLVDDDDDDNTDAMMIQEILNRNQSMDQMEFAILDHMKCHGWPLLKKWIDEYIL